MERRALKKYTPPAPLPQVKVRAPGGATMMVNPSGTPDRQRQGQDVDTAMIDRVVGNLKNQFLAPPGSANNMGPMKPWFDPQRPIAPLAQEQTFGRQFDFRAGYNLSLQTRPEENTSFFQLRSLADSFDILRIILETRKDQIEAFNWEVRPMEDFEDDPTAIADAKKANEFLQMPDRMNPFSTWLRMILEDVFVLDAAAILPRKTKGGKIWGFELIDAATIQRLIDNTGRTPLPPDPAYRSILHGVPAADYTFDDLRYYMRNPRTWKVYGYGPVEQILMTVNIALRRELSQLQFFTEGNIPEAIASVPETWSIETIAQFQAYWDTMLEGNTAERRHMKFLPTDASKIKFTKEGGDLKDTYDEWLTRIVCFAFSIPPSPFIREMNRSTAQTAQAASRAEGLVPILNWLASIMTQLIRRDMELPNVEFRWDMDEQVDPLTQAQIDKIYVEAQVKTPDEIRDQMGLDPMPDEEKEKAWPSPAAPTDTPGFGPDGKPLPHGFPGSKLKPEPKPTDTPGFGPDNKPLPHGFPGSKMPKPPTPVIAGAKPAGESKKPASASAKAKG